MTTINEKNLKVLFRGFETGRILERWVTYLAVYLSNSKREALYCFGDWSRRGDVSEA
jgi:hypothetical protein